MAQKKIYSVVGTRAQLIKMAPVHKMMEDEAIEYEFIYTAQHRETIEMLIKDFGIKMPDRTIYDSSEANTITKFAGWGGQMLLKILRPRKIFPEKGLVLVHGDTASCAWAAVTAKLAGCKVAHVESGLRSYNIFHPFPEELMRLITFQFADVYYSPNEWAYNNLSKYKGEKINTGANTLYESVMLAVKKESNTEYDFKKYIVTSIHRFENIFNSRFEDTIIPQLEVIAEKGFTLVFVLHPSTREVLFKNKKKLYNRLEANPNIVLHKRLPFTKFIKLLSGSEFVITDGGSNQEELSYLGKPALLFRDRTERIEGLGENIVISKYDPEIAMNFVETYKERAAKMLRIEAEPSKIIIDHIRNWYLN